MRRTAENFWFSGTDRDKSRGILRMPEENPLKGSLEILWKNQSHITHHIFTIICNSITHYTSFVLFKVSIYLECFYHFAPTRPNIQMGNSTDKHGIWTEPKSRSNGQTNRWVVKWQAVDLILAMGPYESWKSNLGKSSICWWCCYLPSGYST